MWAAAIAQSVRVRELLSSTCEGLSGILRDHAQLEDDLKREKWPLEVEDAGGVDEGNDAKSRT